MKRLRLLKEFRVEAFLFLLALLPQLIIALGNPNTILDWYSSDDGFFYFQVARNLATGHGFTFDGINLTNGFHPLWLFLITPIFFFAQFDLLLPLRILVISSALLSAASAILLYRLLARYVAEGGAALAAMLWIVVPPIHDITLHAGVEAGLNAFCILLFWHQLVVFPQEKNPKLTYRKLVLLGFTGSLAILSRLDNVFLVAAGGLLLIWRLWSSPRKTKPWPWRFSTGMALFAPIAFLMLAYLAWNQLVFGTPMPVSGEVKLWWGTLRNTVYGFPVRHMAAFWGQFVTNDPELGPWSLLTSPFYSLAENLLLGLGSGITLSARRIVLISLGGLLIASLSVLIWRQRSFLRKAALELGLLPFFLGCFAQIVYYKASGSVAQQPWYWVSEMILLLIISGLILGAGWRAFAPIQKSKRLVWGPPLSLLLISLLSINFIAFVGAAIRAPGDGSNHFYLARARWLEQNTESGALIGATGAGNLAYFIQDRTIINMDGLMNSHDYLLAMKADRGAEFLANEGLDYVFGNEYILTQTNPYAPMLDGHLQPYSVFAFGDRELQLWRFVP